MLSSPERQLSNVVLPLPLCPIIATISPSSTARSMPLRASTRSFPVRYSFLILLARIIMFLVLAISLELFLDPISSSCCLPARHLFQYLYRTDTNRLPPRLNSSQFLQFAQRRTHRLAIHPQAFSQCLLAQPC